METDTISITIELRLGGETVGGFATSSDGRRLPFSGWVGLMGAIDALVAGDDD